jgi:hypothetical protein
MCPLGFLRYYNADGGIILSYYGGCEYKTGRVE